MRFVLLVLLLVVSVRSEAKTVLMSGETKLIGDEEVTCSEPKSKWAKAYYECVEGSFYVALHINLISEHGKITWDARPMEGKQLDACRSLKAVLEKNRHTIREFTEVAVCDSYSLNGQFQIRVLTPSPAISYAKSVQVDSLEDCVKRANEFNSKKLP